MIFQLVYVSKAAVEMSVAELEEILETARSNNAERDITGMLLHHDASFIQVLEGEHSKVEALFTNIERDPRHNDTNVVLRTEVEERAFGEWSMGYERTSKLEDVPEGFHYFLERGYRSKKDADNAAARKALLAFKDGRWRK